MADEQPVNDPDFPDDWTVTVIDHEPLVVGGVQRHRVPFRVYRVRTGTLDVRIAAADFRFMQYLTPKGQRRFLSNLATSR